MSNINSYPRIVYGGINDKSRGQRLRGISTYPQHAPLLRLFTATGDEKTQFVGATDGGFNAMYGAESLNRRSKFFNNQSLLAENLLANGNGFFVKRLIPEDARKSRLIVAIETVADDLQPVSVRLSGFNYNGLVLGGGAIGQQPLVPGIRARIVLLPAVGEVGTAAPRPGTMLSERDGTQSIIHPLFELPAKYFGQLGDNLGMRIWAPNYANNESFDETTANDFNTRMFRVQFMERQNANNTPSIITTAFGEDYVDVCFKQGVYSASTDKEYYIGDVLIKAYSDDGYETGLDPLVSPFEKIHVYEDYIETVQQLFHDVEVAANAAAATSLVSHEQVDFLTARHVDGDPYHAVEFLDALQGGITLGNATTIYATGGSDGTTTLEKYEELVTRENINFGLLGDLYENIAVYRFSHIYDTGLSMEGKFAMMETMAARKDIKNVFTTLVEAENRMPTISEEISRGQVLETRLQSYPESLLYGTGVCRAEIIYQSGELVGGKYNKPVPQVLDYAVRWAEFGGDGSGKLRVGRDIDSDENNKVTLIKNINVEYFNSRAQSTAWASGGTYSLTCDVRLSYYPCVRSIHRDTTSVLLSPITTHIAGDIARLATGVHAKLSGNAKLTKEQLIERSNDEIRKATEDRYAGRVTIVPETYFTQADDEAGTSWRVKVKLYANNPRTTMFFEIETYRTEALG